ncbi:hypothetical protein [Peribacillus sp. YIM B13482]|uniref:hypothetical protein n=1 Tax=Peribacillus sp. YIM B13482 TaxID=3366298 RepID=UPI003670E4B8
MKKIEVKAINVKRIIVPAVASVMLFSAFTPISKAFASEIKEPVQSNTEVSSEIVDVFYL